jgi:hypothetical protein
VQPAVKSAALFQRNLKKMSVDVRFPIFRALLLQEQFTIKYEQYKYVFTTEKDGDVHW